MPQIANTRQQTHGTKVAQPLYQDENEESDETSHTGGRREGPERLGQFPHSLSTLGLSGDTQQTQEIKINLDVQRQASA